MGSLNHIAIIPDGNRRFAKKNAIDLRKAYSKGFRKVTDVVNWSIENKVKILTIWGLSYENLNRSDLELKILFALMDEKISEALDDDSYIKKGVRVSFIGRLDLLPKHLQEKLRRLEGKTSSGSNLSLNIAIAYGGLEEIANAACKICADNPKEISEAVLLKELYLKEKVDLVVRTGGYFRLSGFLPIQTAYAELFFSKKLWPEFGKPDFLNAISFFNSTKRNFGK